MVMKVLKVPILFELSSARLLHFFFNVDCQLYYGLGVEVSSSDY